MERMISEPARQIPVRESFDVAVCGGGIAGISAALAAARNHRKVVLLEREFLLGGLATAGLITIYLPLCDGNGKQVSFGIAEELLRFSVRHGYEGKARGYDAWVSGEKPEDRVKNRFEVQYNPQVFALDAEQLLRENGVEIRYGIAVCAVQTEKEKITHLITESKSGRTAIAVKSVVDCTGDADVARQSGEKTTCFSQGNDLAAWYYSVENGKNQLNMVGCLDVPELNHGPKAPKPIFNEKFFGLDVVKNSRQMCLSHEHILKHYLEKGRVGDTYSLATVPTILQIRMTRRLVGRYEMDDGEMHREFSDSVGMFSDWRKRGPVYELPMRCLYGERVRNLYCAGRNISVRDAMWDITRVIPVCAVSGQAAGTAAALFPDSRDLSLPRLQQCLRQAGVKLHEGELTDASGC